MAASVAAVGVVLEAAVPALEVPSIARCCSIQPDQLSATCLTADYACEAVERASSDARAGQTVVEVDMVGEEMRSTKLPAISYRMWRPAICQTMDMAPTAAAVVAQDRQHDMSTAHSRPLAVDRLYSSLPRLAERPIEDTCCAVAGHHRICSSCRHLPYVLLAFGHSNALRLRAWNADPVVYRACSLSLHRCVPALGGDSQYSRKALVFEARAIWCLEADAAVDLPALRRG